MLLASAAELFTIFLSLQLTSLPLIVLVGYAKRDPRSGEAALKYLLLVLVSTAVLLYGMSLIYGSLGTSTLSEIGAKRSPPRHVSSRRRDRPRAAAHGLRLQDHGRAVPLLGARRLRGRADAGHRVHVGRLEVRRLRAGAARHRQRPKRPAELAPHLRRHGRASR